MSIKFRTKNLKQFLNSSIIVGFPKYFLSIFPLGGDTPFCAFGYEIIDFYLTRKKTGRRYGWRSCIYTFYNLAIASVTAGTVCPAAHFCVGEICIFTNNVVQIKYRNQNQFHNHNHHCVFIKIFSTHFRYWRRYTFLRVRLRNRRFLPHPQKNWSPLRTACTLLNIFPQNPIPFINIFSLCAFPKK